jgi:ligand-binding SRPBCC domain-containing protein
MEVAALELFRWHAESGALERLTPPWERVEMIEHSGYIEGRQFRDVQTSGPFRRWEHTHLFIPQGPEACRLEDRIEYELPFGALGNFLGGSTVRRKLARVFEYRHRVTAEAMRARKECHSRE